MVTEGMEREMQGRSEEQCQKRVAQRIRKTKADSWTEWIEEGKDIWAIVKNPCRLKENGNAITEQGVLLENDEDLKKAIIRHNLKTEGEVDEEREEGQWT